MAARKRSTIARRRRLSDEDERQSVTERAADSGSEVTGSVASDADGGADGDAESESEADSGVATAGKIQRKASPLIARSEVVADGVGGGGGGDEPKPVAVARPETLGDRRRREHDEYKKKRDSDPAFIPNRGAFFMHDSRSHPGPNAFRPAGGRGRGRGVGGPFAPAQRASGPEATDSPWQHDLHEAVNPTATAKATTATTATANTTTTNTTANTTTATRPPRNFSTTVHTHNAVVRVLLPAMKAPVVFHNVPIKSHTRLPNHRPPLRRDKPVRISLPPAAPRYIFPTVDRSFIFIPRALRPNQQGFGRGRGRFGSMGGGFSSRRTSVYGGSVYSPSVALSRRSSIARDNMVSPAGSIMSRNGSFIDPSRPVVRLPRLPTGPAIISPTTSYPPPQKPTFRENWHGQLPMHQPRPTKNVNVAGIESPSLNFNPPQQQEQPFHQQVPAHMASDPFYQHSRQPSYPASTGTPLNNIPERAIHAPAFQPYPYAPYPYFYPPVPPQPQPQPYNMVPVFVPGAAQYTHPPVPATVPVPPPPSTGMVAVEQNGMTFYMDAAQVPQQQQQQQPFLGTAPEYAQNAGYSMQGMGGMMTPAPEGYYYPQPFYPQ